MSVPRRVLVAPQEFKGSLTAGQAAAAIAAGVRRALPGAEVVELPVADGGPGTASIVGRARDGRMVERTVRGPLGDPVLASYALVERQGERALAVIEAAAAAGLVLVPADRRDATRASSFGVGELILDAIERGAGSIIVGVGGTGTNDGGAGAAQALGLRLLDPAGASLPPGGIHLVRLARVEAGPISRRDGIEYRIAVDVQNELLGAAGATAVYGPQKGLLDWQAPAMEMALRHWAARLADDLGLDVTSVPGAGAGGGLPGGLLAALPGARIEPGAALVAQAIGLEERVRDADLVITGEGALDLQTAYGKSVAHVVATATATGVPCLAVAGVIEGRPEALADAEALTAGASAEEIEAAIADAPARLAAATERLVRRWTGPR